MIGDGVTVGVDECWSGAWRGRTVLVAEGGLLRMLGVGEADGARADVELPGTLIPTLTDHHVHLGLIDAGALMSGGITAVTDLGWIPAAAGAWREAATSDTGLPAVTIAGALLTCEGGYPSRSGWAPAGAWVELADAAESSGAVAAQVRLGASIIKTTLNSDAGPTPSDELLRAIIAAAHEVGLPAVVHAQGAGEAQRAFEAGADRLAHAPFSERLDDDLIATMAEAGMQWISTLDIHGWGRPTPAYETAVDNVRRFAECGGRIHYGTDLGNGPLPVGVNGRELRALARAGLEPERLVATIAGSDDAALIGPRFALLPGGPPNRAAAVADWLATARGVTVDALVAGSGP